MTVIPWRLAVKIGEETADGCWPWLASLDRGGYGRIKWDGKARSAHRLVYSLLAGPIPRGLHLDHLCRNRSCVNPAHLEPVDHRTNVLRGVSPAARHAVKAACPEGHRYDAENTYRRPDGRRGCRTCRAADVLDRRARGLR